MCLGLVAMLPASSFVKRGHLIALTATDMSGGYRTSQSHVFQTTKHGFSPRVNVRIACVP
jgi:hypothetical protein